MTATAVALVLALSAPAFADQISTSYVDQIGSSNSATVSQWATGGNTNISDIDQTSWQKATVVQGGLSSSNTSGVYQTGSGGGVADVWQEGNTTSNTSWVTQDTNSATPNTATVKQYDGVSNYSDIKQNSGDGNIAAVTQYGAGNVNSSWVTQSGSNNTASVTQQ
jgi:hypothetical protein